jgi:hypothetical protein
VPEPKVPTNYFRVRACSPNVEQEEVTFRPFPLLAPIHPSAWKGRSRKSTCGIVHNTLP